MNSVIPNRDRPGIVAIPYRSKIDGITEVISDELNALGYQPVHFQIGSRIPEKAEVVFSFGPYGKFLTIPRQLAQIPPAQKPIFVHWNTEGIPDLRMPWILMRSSPKINGFSFPSAKCIRTPQDSISLRTRSNNTLRLLVPRVPIHRTSISRFKRRSLYHRGVAPQ